jgi:hypothetical protein
MHVFHGIGGGPQDHSGELSPDEDKGARAQNASTQGDLFGGEELSARG